MAQKQYEKREAAGFVPKRCTVCGAKVYQYNPRVKTCDSTCTRASKEGRTRQEQIEFEIDLPNPATEQDEVFRARNGASSFDLMQLDEED